MTDNIGIVIPARHQSTRLPGKPLINLAGKSMIQRTWEKCVKALPEELVYVATDSELVASHVSNFGGRFIMTSCQCLTGTDRIAEANKKLNFDLVINVQGDEPIIDPEDIKIVINFAQNNPGNVVCAISKVDNEEDFRSATIPKVAKSLSNDLLYMSRAPIPGSKDGGFHSAYKQICIYAFPKKALDFFSKIQEKTPFEYTEDIEILRFIEQGVGVKLVEVSGKSIAVDVESDIQRVLRIIKKDER